MTQYEKDKDMQSSHFQDIYIVYASATLIC